MTIILMVVDSRSANWNSSNGYDDDWRRYDNVSRRRVDEDSDDDDDDGSYDFAPAA